MKTYLKIQSVKHIKTDLPSSKKKWKLRSVPLPHFLSPRVTQDEPKKLKTSDNTAWKHLRAGLATYFLGTTIGQAVQTFWALVSSSWKWQQKKPYQECRTLTQLSGSVLGKLSTKVIALFITKLNMDFAVSENLFFNTLAHTTLSLLQVLLHFYFNITLDHLAVWNY